jgi:hypothetical protein
LEPVTFEDVLGVAPGAGELPAGTGLVAPPGVGGGDSCAEAATRVMASANAGTERANAQASSQRRARIENSY